MALDRSVMERCIRPFLIDPNDNYRLSRRKVAFVGQQIKGWSNSDDISIQMREYRDFNLGIKYQSTPFWNNFGNTIRKLEKRLAGSEYSSAWLNLNLI
ncbi:MAG: hypothetical protein U1F59_11510 [Candidatus Competibacteraceae bacterium]